MTKINILTRTGNREKYYQTLKSTISSQTYQDIRHIKSNDNPNCTYLSSEEDVYHVEKDKSLGKAFYNVYLNEIGSKVTDGWVLILDDDCKLTDNVFIERLANECSNASENEILIFQSGIFPQRLILPINSDFENKFIKPCAIDMACFCMHHSVLKDVQFDGRRMGDYNFLKKVEEKTKYAFKFVRIPPGIWANYDGAKNGRN